MKAASEVLAYYVTAESYDRLPAQVRAKAKLCLIDSLGCLLAAYELPVAQSVRGLLQKSGSGDCQLVGSALRTSAGYAAFGNATLINALDFDDIYKKGHIGATVIGTALALAQQRDCSGQELMEAIVAGYEVSTRVGLSLRQDNPRKTIHGHGSWQALGAAAAAAKLLRLDVVQAAHALAIAASCAPVASIMKTVYGNSPTMTKNNFGAASQTGFNAAVLAAEGYEGPLDVFEGEAGFWRMCGADGADLVTLSRGLGEHYEIMHVGFKPYSCCRILQSSVEAASHVYRQAGARGFERLVITGPAIITERPFNDPLPRDFVGVQFSAPFSIALALSGVPPGPDWFSPAQLGDPCIRALAQAIEIRAEPHSEESSGASHRRACAQLHTSDGQVFTHTVPIALGEADNPLSDTQLYAKFLALAGRQLDTPETVTALERLSSLEGQVSVRSMLRELAPRD